MYEKSSLLTCQHEILSHLERGNPTPIVTFFPSGHGHGDDLVQQERAYGSGSQGSDVADAVLAAVALTATVARSRHDVIAVTHFGSDDIVLRFILRKGTYLGGGGKVSTHGMFAIIYRDCNFLITNLVIK